MKWKAIYFPTEEVLSILFILQLNRVINESDQ